MREVLERKREGTQRRGMQGCLKQEQLGKPFGKKSRSRFRGGWTAVAIERGD
jgi:hypothetical protein